MPSQERIFFSLYIFWSARSGLFYQPLEAKVWERLVSHKDVGRFFNVWLSFQFSPRSPSHFFPCRQLSAWAEKLYKILGGIKYWLLPVTYCVTLDGLWKREVVLPFSVQKAVSPWWTAKYYLIFIFPLFGITQKLIFASCVRKMAMKKKKKIKALGFSCLLQQVVLKRFHIPGGLRLGL